TEQHEDAGAGDTRQSAVQGTSVRVGNRARQYRFFQTDSRFLSRVAGPCPAPGAGTRARERAGQRAPTGSGQAPELGRNTLEEAVPGVDELLHALVLQDPEHISEVDAGGLERGEVLLRQIGRAS